MSGMTARLWVAMLALADRILHALVGPTGCTATPRSPYDLL